MKKTLYTLTVFLLVLAFLFVSCNSTGKPVAGQEPKLGTVQTVNGLARGVVGQSAEVTMFKGIPFAAPPVGANRWREPQPAQNWSGVKVFDSYAPMAQQILATNDHWGPDFYYDFMNTGVQPNMSEDCLYLNVTTTVTDANVKTAKRPVYLYYHGGASMHGYSYEVAFDPTVLAQKGVIVVTAAYRLGVFGWYTSADLDKEQGGTSGNYGTLDCIQALRWIKENIAAFGGDPNNVTIGGQSAGSQATFAMLNSPVARGEKLFNKAILQSTLIPNRTYDTKARKQELATKYLTEKGLETKTLSELRSIPANTFVSNDMDKSLYYGKGFGIAVGGHAFPTQPGDSFTKEGFLSGINILFGSNDGELNAGEPKTTVEAFRTSTRKTYADLYDKHNFETLYPSATDAQALFSMEQLDSETKFMTSRLFGDINKQLKNNNKLYEYYFSWWTPGRDMENKWAWHSSELWYVFNSMRDIPQQRKWTADDKKMGNTMSSYWANFIKTGDPNGRGLPKWPELTSTNQFLKIGNHREFVFAQKSYLYEGTPLAGRDALLKEQLIRQYNLQKFF